MKSNTHFSLTNHSLANDSLLNNSALNILNERYAKGEIDEEEYTKKKMIVKKQGNPVPLTSNEFTILIALLTNPGQIFSREQLVTKAFGIDYDGFDRTADTHIKNIRQKIEHDPKNPRYILSVYGMGYKFNG
ncbi:winged helix-turn-helix domain-containing protein [Clostridium bowmanii]|nr:winged helix-turn-helix domain-containing protein [Clostridium bowmanii]